MKGQSCPSPQARGLAPAHPSLGLSPGEGTSPPWQGQISGEGDITPREAEQGRGGGETSHPPPKQGCQQGGVGALPREEI